MAEFGAIAGGVLYGKRLKVQRILRENNALSSDTAVDPEKVGITEKGILGFMEKQDLLKKTSDGRVYLTEKGRQ